MCDIDHIFPIWLGIFQLPVEIKFMSHFCNIIDLCNVYRVRVPTSRFDPEYPAEEGSPNRPSAVGRSRNSLLDTASI